MNNLTFSRRLVSQDDAAIIARPDVPRSKFVNQWTRKTAFDAGYLIPFLVDEVLPGDHIKYDVQAYVRLSTPLFPILDNLRIDTFFFYVPNRILWTNWVRMMGEQDNPADSIAYSVPQLGWTVSPPAVGSIADHMGLPIRANGINGILANALPFRAYNMIFNQWFRDQNAMASVWFDPTSNTDNLNNYALRRRAKAHDYFTSALPWPQKFSPLTMPVGVSAPISGLGHVGTSYSVAPQNNVQQTPPLVTEDYPFAVLSTDAEIMAMRVNNLGRPDVYADLTQATGVSINVLRQAFLVQQLLERDARGGTRYTELLEAHFGIDNPDGRLQRPEYIGGGSTPMNIQPIAQTAPTEGQTVGALGAAGAATGGHTASVAATEHGVIIGLINARSEISYSQGLHKMWSRSTRYDFYWPSLAGLGEQAIAMREIYALGIDANDGVVFGYQERWHEYRTRTSEVTGIMRPGVTGTLDAWHLSQNFGVAPSLGADFLQDTPPMDRILAAGELAQGQQFLADILINRVAVRPIPTYGTPVSLGRF